MLKRVSDHEKVLLRILLLLSIFFFFKLSLNVICTLPVFLSIFQEIKKIRS